MNRVETKSLESYFLHFPLQKGAVPSHLKTDGDESGGEGGGEDKEDQEAAEY